MTQMDLFQNERYVPPVLARPTDPVTSQQAAADVEGKLGEMQAQMLAVFCRHAATAVEAAAECASDNAARMESFRKRTKELERLGHITHIGTRPCKITGKNAMVYTAAELPQ